MIQYRTLLLLMTSYLLQTSCSVNWPRLCHGEDVAEHDAEDETFLLVTGYRSDVVYRSDGEDRVADLTYDKRCPSSGTINTSTCPSYPVMNFNPHRLPPVVVEARCSCETCLSVGGVTHNVCRPIYYYRSVLEVPPSHRQGRQPCYARVIRRFTVGCHCALTQREKRTSTVTPM